MPILRGDRRQALPPGADQDERVRDALRPRPGARSSGSRTRRGIDVGDIAEKAELLGLGQSLIYSIQQTDIPMMLVVLRKGTAAAHYVMGGPTANRHNAFTLGTATTEIYVMHGETAAAASYSRGGWSRRRRAASRSSRSSTKMNELVKSYYDNSRPLYCAQHGLGGRGGQDDGAPQLS